MSERKSLDLANVRRQYDTGTLERTDLDSDPLSQFQSWYADAEKACRFYPNNMVLSTVEQGRPHSRTVLLKGVDQGGFVFYTNYGSRKAAHIAADSAVALTIFWEELERQVNVSGLAVKVSDAESDAYFATRPRGSQLGAWASEQSAVIDSRELLDICLSETEKRYQGQEIPRPPFWGGFRVIPEQIEFWQGRTDRLHDRFRYFRKEDGGWSISRLSP